MIKISNHIIVFTVLCTQLSVILATPPCALHEITHTKCALQDSMCLTKKSNVALKSFINGIPELGIEKLDTMFIDLVKLNNDGIIHELKNFVVEGLKNATINDLSFNEDLKIMRLSFDTTLVVNSDYTLDGFLFMQPINGEGTVTYTFENVQSDMIFFYDIIKEENGKHILNIKDYRYGLKINGGIEYDYKNLYHGDKKKNDIVNAFLKQNWPIISNVFGKDFYDGIYTKIFKAIKMYIRAQNLEDIILFS